MGTASGLTGVGGCGRTGGVGDPRSMAWSWGSVSLVISFWFSGVAGSWRRWSFVAGSGWVDGGAGVVGAKGRVQGGVEIDSRKVGSRDGSVRLLILGVGLVLPRSDCAGVGSGRSRRCRRVGPGRWSGVVRRWDGIDFGLAGLRVGSDRLLVLGVGLVLPWSGWWVKVVVADVFGVCVIGLVAVGRLWQWDEVAVGCVRRWRLLQPGAVIGGFQRLWAFSFWAWILSRRWAWACALGPIARFVESVLFSVVLLLLLVGLVSRSTCRIFCKSLILSVKAVVGVFNRMSILSGWFVAKCTQYYAGLRPCDLLASAEVSGRCWDGPPNSSLLWLAPIPVIAIYFGHFSATIRLIRSL